MTKVRLTSFGYKHSRPPKEAHCIIDCRDMPNPHNVPGLKQLTGKDKLVQDFVRRAPEFTEMVTAVILETNKANEAITVSFGCVGGRHRSVAMAEMVAKSLRAMELDVDVSHQELQA